MNPSSIAARLALPLALSSGWIWSKGTSYLTSALFFSAAVLRSLLMYGDSPILPQALGLLLTWLLLYVSEPPLTRRWSFYFYLYLVLQTMAVVILLSLPGPPDFYTVLFAVLCMQIAEHLGSRAVVVAIIAFAPLTALPLVPGVGITRALAFTLLYTGADALLASYTLAMQRARAARARNQELVEQLQGSNRELQAYARRLEQLAVTRERHRLARELHDSVTQTAFSMTLTTQSALLLLERDPTRVAPQLERLSELAASALREMRTLISELRPAAIGEGGLAASLRQHLAERRLENLSITLQVEGREGLPLAEEQGLYRIAQEAVNNIVKHAEARDACIRLHLEEPYWMEIQDDGRGFDLEQARRAGRVGLASMRERAVEMGWSMEIETRAGAGTRIRVEKIRPAERQA